MSRPSPEVLSLLTPTERAAFELGDLIVSRFGRLARRWNGAIVGAVIHAAGGRRLRVHGLGNLAGIGFDDRVLLVSNHRSFFDLYVITAVAFWRTTLPRRVLCPVRSTFFYDHPLGPAVNLAMSGMSMFPPILRDPVRGAAFNKWSIDRAIEELREPGTMLGLHPEGTRNKGSDPYSFLPAQPGVGRIALEAKEAAVVPVFIHGLSNDLREEYRRNWLDAARFPIEVSFGAPIDLSDLRAQATRAANCKRAADRCLDGIRRVAEGFRASIDR